MRLQSLIITFTIALAAATVHTPDWPADASEPPGRTPLVNAPGDVPLNAVGPERVVVDTTPVYTYSHGDRSLARAQIGDAALPATVPGWSGNFVRNPGFEEDFVNRAAEGHVLSFKGDWYYNQQDRIPDYWKLGSRKDPFAGWTRIESGAHAGHYALRLAAGASATQTFPGATYNAGGSAWSPGVVVKLPLTAAEVSRFRQPWRASVWVRGGGAIGLNLRRARDGRITRGAAASAPPAAGWQLLSVELPAEKAPQPHDAMSITLEGPGEFDDVVLMEKLAAAPNLMPDPSFEKVDDGYPVGWSEQRKYRAIGPTYYVWTDWNHVFAPNRGRVGIDTLVSNRGRNSLRFDVYPGDEKYVESELIRLNQKTTHIIEVGAWVRADRIKLVDVRCVDQDGFYMPAVRPRAPEWKAGGSFLFGNGTFAWRYVRKFFGSLGNQPVKGVRVRLAARGFNGHTLEDFGTRPQSMQVGTVWWDDVRVTERASTAAQLKARGVRIPASAPPRPGRRRAGVVDLGERLVGENVLTYRFVNLGGSARFQLRLTTRLPGGDPVVTTSGKVTAKKGRAVVLAAPYTIDRLAGHLARQGSFRVELLRDARVAAAATYRFNTWPVVADIDVARAYSLPRENPVTWSVNFGIAAATLATVRSVEVQLADAATGKVMQVKRFADVKKAFAETLAALPRQPSFEFNLPTPAYWVDRRNLIVDKLDLSTLKVWPHDDPVRDSKLVVRGLDAAGKEVFRQDSDAFGRMAQRPARPPITDVRIRDDGAVLINGRPTVLTGGAGHPSNRMPQYTDAVKAQLGLLGSRLSHGRENNHDQLRKMWSEHGLYALMIKPVEGMGSTVPVKAMNDKQKAALKTFAAAGGLRNVVSINTGGWEAMINFHNPAEVKAHAELNDWLRQATGRPIAVSTSGAYNAWWISEVTLYDIDYAETEMWGPMDFNVIYAPYVRRQRQQPAAWVYSPQLYDNCPYARYRFETYENMLRGSAGVSWIQGIGDPTLSRGLAGELRGIEQPFFSRDKAPRVRLEPPGLSHRVTHYKGKTYIFATNCGPVACGRWTWHTEEKFKGRASHDGVSVNTYWQMPGGVRIHGFRGLPMPELIRDGDKVVQYVRVDPEQPPEWVMLAVRGDGKFAHNSTWGTFDFKRFRKTDANMLMFSELNHSVWHEAYIVADDRTYRRAIRIMGAKQAKALMKDRYDKHRKIVAERIYQPAHFHDRGKLPEPGVWTRLEVDAARVGLVGKLVDGFAYLTSNGRALWDYTVLERGGKVVRVFSDDAAGIERAALSAVRIHVDGLKQGTRINVLFERREIVAEDGFFVDDFVGVDTYGYESRAPQGDLLPYPDLPAKQKDEDKELPRMLPSGYGYNYGPTAVHMYEIPD